MLISNEVVLKNGGMLSSSDDLLEVPRVPLAKFLLEELQKALPRCGSRPWVIDARSGTSVKFDEIEDQSRRIASALHKLGFRRGHVLFFVTYEMAQLYLIQLAVWRLGGAVRGSYQKETPAEYARQMAESHIEFALVSAETATKLQEAISLLDWPVQLFSCGTTSVKGATSFTELILDDGEDLSFLKFIVIGGSVLDPTTVKMFAIQYPKLKLKQVYGMSECPIVTSTAVYQKSYGCLPMAENGGELFVSSGTPLSYIQLMPVRSNVNKKGWLHSGDIGFYDDFKNIYIVDRRSFLFKYCTNLVSPSVIENVLTEHEAVHGVGVVGVPHIESTNLTRAYIVLRPGYSVRAEVLQALVASRLPEQMHLHGGVRFLKELMQNRGGKLDRMTLRQLALVDNISSLIHNIMQNIIAIL
ncbi:hypothetical protein B566_EDAN017687 [Ephemera danica]|nr:hypothetical protein B566_EDAN017687 [Ephemera danica]